MMAVGGVLPLFNMLLMQIDMDSCLGLSRGVLQNNLCLVQRSLITQAPSGCSSTMVNPHEHEDSGLSQSAPVCTSPPQPQAAHDSAREAPFSLSETLEHHRSQGAAEVNASELTGASPTSPDKNPDSNIVPNPASGVEGQSTGEGDAPPASEEVEGGPPKKRARTIPEDKTESAATASTTERSHSHREAGDAGPSISLGRSPSERETGGSHSRSQPEAKPWWLTTPPAPPSAPALQTSTFDTGGADAPLQRLPQQQQQLQLLQQQQQQQLQQLQQQQQQQQLHQQRALQQQQQQLKQLQLQYQQRQQEWEFFPKQPPVYDPDMLSSMESGHDRAGTTLGELGSSRDWPDRPNLPPRQDTPELPFFTKRESPVQRSPSVASGHSGEEGPPRPTSSGQSKGKELAVLDTFGHGTHMGEMGPKGLPVRNLSPAEGQQRFSLPLHGTPFLQGGQGQPTFAGPGVNSSFYARFLGSMPHESSSVFIPPPISHGRPAQGMPGQRPIGHMEMVPPPLLQQPASNEMAQKLAAAAPPFLPRFQPSDAAKLGFPYAPYDVMQSAQRPQQLPVGRPGFRGPAHGTMQPFEMRHGSGGHFLPQFGFPPDPQRPIPQVPLSRPIAAGGFQHLFPPSQGPHTYGRPGLPSWGSLPGTEISTDLHLERAGFDAGSQGQGFHVPAPVAVTLEGRDVGLRINLQDFNSYESFAAQLRAMLYSNVPTPEDLSVSVGDFNPTTAIPGYQITYEDEEGDTLLAGDTSWREFVRLAKRIKILAIKRSSRPAGTS